MFLSNTTSWASMLETKRGPSAVSTRFHLRTHWSCCMVAHRPAAWSLVTSTSIASRLPADTTALPSVWTCIIKVVACVSL